MRLDRERLLDIIEAIDNINRRASAGKAAFLADEMLQVWMVHHIQIIGEAATGISQQLRQKRAEIQWRDVISMRNVLVHHYFGIDLEQVWDTIMLDLPRLRNQVEKILADTAE